MYEAVTDAVGKYVDDVKERRFPNEVESFHRNLVEVKPVKKEK
jgi:ketopantoate hydroxymethyltransferase